MNRTEFLNQLRSSLYALPPAERDAAVQFYTEYFDDAGPENEQRVIAELGSPLKVAQQILQGCDERYAPPAYAPAQPRARSSWPWWMVLVAVLGFPVWLPLLIVAVVLLFVVLVVAVVLAFSLVAVVAALLVAGFAGLVALPLSLTGLSVPFVSFPTGLTGLGVVLACLGLGLLLVWPCVWLCTRGLPLLWASFVSILRRWGFRRR